MLKCMIWNFWGSYNNLCFQVTELKMKDEKEKWNQKSEYLYFFIIFLIFFFGGEYVLDRLLYFGWTVRCRCTKARRV